jgi:hypothetical protein
VHYVGDQFKFAHMVCMKRSVNLIKEKVTEVFGAAAAFDYEKMFLDGLAWTYGHVRRRQVSLLVIQLLCSRK